MVSIFFGTAWIKHWYFYILLTNFLTPSHIPHPFALDPLWSLAVEEQFYLVWPFAVYLLSVRRLRQLCFLLIVMAPLLRGLVHFSVFWPTYMLTPFRMDLLAVGALICIEWRSHHQVFKRWSGRISAMLGLTGLTLLLVLMYFGVTIYTNSRLSNALLYESTLLICAGTIIYALRGRGVGWLCTRPMSYIGQVSYSMYLAHIGVYVLVQKHFSGVVAFAIEFAVVMLYAAISWHLIESRLLPSQPSQVSV